MSLKFLPTPIILLLSLISAYYLFMYAKQIREDKIQSLGIKLFGFLALGVAIDRLLKDYLGNNNYIFIYEVFFVICLFISLFILIARGWQITKSDPFRHKKFLLALSFFLSSVFIFIALIIFIAIN